MYRRIKIYPIVLPTNYIAKQYRRERNWTGRLLNDIEYWIIRRILG
jgi:hypothetical protein